MVYDFFKKNNNRMFLILRISILIISIYFVLYIVDLNLLALHLKNIPPLLLFSLLILNVFRAWLTGLRWHFFNPDITGQLSKWQYFRFIMIAYPFNLIMPGALGGDFARTAMTLSTVNDKRIDNVIAIIADRFVGLLSILLLGTIAFIFVRDVPDSSFFAIVLTAIYMIIVVAIIFLTNKSILKWLEAVVSRLGSVGGFFKKVIQTWQNAMLFFKANKKNVIYGLLLCLPIHIISFFTAYLLARSLAINVSFLNVSLIIALVWIVTAIPITISGAGVRELSMIYLFSLYGVDAEPATALSIYLYIISLLLGLIGFLFIIDWGKWVSSIKLKLESRQG